MGLLRPDRNAHGKGGAPGWQRVVLTQPPRERGKTVQTLRTRPCSLHPHPGHSLGQDSGVGSEQRSLPAEECRGPALCVPGKREAIVHP